MTSTSACRPLGSKSKEERSDEEQREEHWMEPADDLARKKKKKKKSPTSCLCVMGTLQDYMRFKPQAIQECLEALFHTVPLACSLLQK